MTKNELLAEQLIHEYVLSGKYGGVIASVRAALLRMASVSTPVATEASCTNPDK